MLDENKKKQILVVDDEVVVASDIMDRLEGLGYKSAGPAVTGKEAVEKALEIKPDLIIMDIALKGEMDGIQSAKRISELMDVPVVFITAFTDDATLERARSVDYFGYLCKPFDVKALSLSVEFALYKHNMERSLRENELKYRGLFNNVNDAIILNGLEDGFLGRFLEVNDVMCVMMGYTREELLGMPGKDIIDFRHAEADYNEKTMSMEKVISEKGYIDFEGRIKKKNSEFVDVDAKSCIYEFKGEKAVLSVIRDISERKESEKARLRLEQHISKAEKKASIREISFGIAHELNTPLNIIMAYLELMLKRLGGSNEFSRYMSLSLEEVNRCKRLISDFSHFLKPALIAGTDVSVNLRELVETSARLADLKKEKNIRLRMNIDKSAPYIRGDKGQMTQLFTNLISNAIQSMPEGGDLLISSERLRNGRGKPAGNVRFYIKDTGVGIPKENIKKVFDPFFTTRRNRNEIGLGLSVCRRIIEGHRGSIRIESEIGKGTKVTGELPAA